MKPGKYTQKFQYPKKDHKGRNNSNKIINFQQKVSKKNYKDFQTFSIGKYSI